MKNTDLNETDFSSSLYSNANLYKEIPSKVIPPLDPKRVEESKKLIENFKEKLSSYPAYLSKESSAALCIQIALKTESIPLHILNVSEQQIIISKLPQEFSNLTDFSVNFDEQKDFILTFGSVDSKKNIDKSTSTFRITFFNSLVNFRYSNDGTLSSVQVKKDGDNIILNESFKINKYCLKKMAGIKTNDIQNEEDLDPLKFPVKERSGNKNAYEIRESVLQMAINWSSQTQERASYYDSPGQVVDLAKHFYRFVENKK